jgi:hypothetical protein
MTGRLTDVQAGNCADGGVDKWRRDLIDVGTNAAGRCVTVSTVKGYFLPLFPSKGVSSFDKVELATP